jgi:hypothetical protein
MALDSASSFNKSSYVHISFCTIYTLHRASAGLLQRMAKSKAELELDYLEHQSIMLQVRK